MSDKEYINDQDLFFYIVFAITFLVATFYAWPIVFIISIVTIIVLRILKTEITISFFLVIISVIAGTIIHQDLLLWATSPISMMHNFYISIFPESFIILLLDDGEFTGFMNAVIQHSWQCIKIPSLWLLFTPFGIFCGSVIYSLHNLFLKTRLAA